MTNDEQIAILSGISVSGVSSQTVGRILRNIEEPFHVTNIRCLLKGLPRHTTDGIAVIRHMDGAGLISVNRAALKTLGHVSSDEMTVVKINEPLRKILHGIQS